MSRPTKYASSYCRDLVEHMRKGYSLSSFAHKIQTSRSTVYSWLEKYEDFKSAYEQGFSAALYFYEQLLIAGITGTSHEAIRGSKKIDSNLLIFTLKTRFHDVYQERQYIDHGTVLIDGKIDITKITDPIELLKIVEELEKRELALKGKFARLEKGKEVFFEGA